jgi:hypothetical protein
VSGSLIKVRPTHGDLVNLNLRWFVPTLTALHAAGTLSAQWPASITPGTRVRVQLPEAQYQADSPRGHLLRGRVTTLLPDTLYLAVTDSLGPLAVPRAFIKRLDLSRGVPSRTTSAVRRGLLAGASTALLFVLFNEMDDASDRASTGTAALVGAGVGVTFGALMGALYPRERWASVRLGVTVGVPR